MIDFALGSKEHCAFQAADKAWSIELQRAYGKHAGDIRYRPAGKGEPRSALRAAYDARETARMLYDLACGMDEHGRPIR